MMNDHFYREYFFILSFSGFLTGCIYSNDQTSQENPNWSFSRVDNFIYLNTNSYASLINFNSDNLYIYEDQIDWNQDINLDEKITEERPRILFDWTRSLTHKSVHITPQVLLKPFTWYEVLFKMSDKYLYMSWRTDQKVNSTFSLNKPSEEVILEYFKDYCGCHSPSGSQIKFWKKGSKSLDLSVLLQVSTRDLELQLIQPGEPSKSALFLSILRDYPMRGAQMPPDESNKLSSEVLWEIEQWILNL